MHAPLPPSLTDGLHAALGHVLDTDLSGLTDGEVLDAVRDLYQAEAPLAAAKARLLAEMDARTAYAAEGAQTASQWTAHRCNIPAGAARHDVLLARSLRRLPGTAAKLADGDIGAHHASRLAQHHRNPRLTEALERAEAMLVAEAVRLAWPLFVKVLAYWAQLADPDGTDEDAEARRARRRLHLSRTLDGSWRIDGQLDPVAGSIVDTALRRVADDLYEADRAEAADRLGVEPIPAELRRTPAQRRADALVELAQRATSAPPEARRPAPLVSVLVSYETFAGRVCELADGTVLAPADIAALLDAAVIERVVFDGPSRVVDIGHQRLFTGALRRIIELKDRTCTHDLCDAPAWRCHVDHVDPWEAGGRTIQDNGRLRCPFHNHLRQRRGPPDRGD